MTYIEQIQADLKQAMLKKESDKVRTLRMLITRLREKKIELKKDPEEKDELAVLKKAAKERQDSIETYSKAGREELAQIEKEELELINNYLPEEMADEALEALVKQVITESGASSMAEMGPVMGAAMKAVAGRADGKRVQAMVKKHLGV
jgi:uncharacterized protein